eukprot:TRINITY_DN2648_c0_g2_i4.p1 TRINITY_DN2648_c0_g2~~TRINITY_DN2648_c0_g2_i4.p1  ORF type:complete len:153 (+),score=39.33 TRINITY_DN2648_c0_g2_i4:47-460(+)
MCIRDRINAELIQHAHQFLNPLKERQLDLRGYKISAIENLGATMDYFECIDLSDNEITKLGNFSLLKRLKSLILTNNRIAKISNFADSLPILENLLLANNRIVELSEIDNLSDFKNLKRLVLLNNVITQVYTSQPSH